MNSEILRLLLDNASKLSFLDAVVLLLIAASFASSATLVIHWIYKHALDKQGDVIKSQEKLIELKDKSIGEYERTIQRIEEAKSRSEGVLAETASRFEQLKNETEANRKLEHVKQAEDLLFKSSYAIGIQIARRLFIRLENCRSIRQLVNVYAAVVAQHHDGSGLPSDELIERITDTEDYFLQQWTVLNRLEEFTQAGGDVQVLTREVLDFAKNQDAFDKRLSELLTFVFSNALPILQKYEPTFADKLRRTNGRHIVG